MKKIYLIRHALPDFPDGKRLCLGSSDIPLGEEGRAQAARMAQCLPPVTAVFSSPLSRALQTARAIGQPVQILDGLRELHMGEWDGRSFEEIRVRYPALYAARGKDLSIPMPGAEPDEAGLERFTAALELAAATAPGDLAVVTHGGITSRFLGAHCGLPRKPGYTEIIALNWDNGIFTLEESK